jgi:hypothetical protein
MATKPRPYRGSGVGARASGTKGKNLKPYLRTGTRGNRTVSRPPRGSKRTTVGKSKRKHVQRGSYSTHGRR